MRDVLDGEPQLAQRLRTPAPEPLLAPLAAPALGTRAAEGLDLILEGFLLHHGSPLHLDLTDVGQRVLAGDYCYAAGLVRVAEPGDLYVISTLAELISTAAGLVARERRDALVPLWLGTSIAVGHPERRREHGLALAALAERDDLEPIGALAGSVDARGAEERLTGALA